MVPTLIVNTEVEATPEAWSARARECGASAVAIALDVERGPLDRATEEACRRLREGMARLERGISCVFASLTAASHFGSREAAARQAALDRVAAALERTAWLGAPVLVLASAAVVGPDCTYAAALNGTHAALQRLRFAAQRRGIVLALAAPQARFLLSPVELRILLDEQCEPSIGVALDVPACLTVGEPKDWMGSLERQISCILLNSMDLQSPVVGEGSLADVFAELGRVAFEGPVCSAQPTVIQHLANV